MGSDRNVDGGKKTPCLSHGSYKIGDVVPMPERKLVVRPNAPIDNRPSFKAVRKGRK